MSQVSTPKTTTATTSGLTTTASTATVTSEKVQATVTDDDDLDSFLNDLDI